MKTTNLFLAVLAVLGIFTLGVHASEVKGSASKSPSEKFTCPRVNEEHTVVKAAPIIMSPEERQILEALSDAKSAGDQEAIFALQAELDGLHGNSNAPCVPAGNSDLDQIEVRFDRHFPGKHLDWGDDNLVGAALLKGRSKINRNGFEKITYLLIM